MSRKLWRRFFCLINVLWVLCWSMQCICQCYSWWMFHWHWSNCKIAPVQVKKSGRIWVTSTSHTVSNSMWICLGVIHYNDVIMNAMASKITDISVVYSDVHQRKHQSSASLAFVRGFHRCPVNSPHKGPVTRKIVSIWWHHHVACRDDIALLTLKRRETHGYVVSTMATDALVLKHQAISIHNAD